MEKLGNLAKKLFPYQIVLILTFFMPLVFAVYQQDENTTTAILLLSLLLINPQVSFFSGIFYGIKNGFQWAFPLFVGLLFFIVILLFFMDVQLLQYQLLYIGCSLLGCWIGSIFKKHIDEMYM
jgi:hypothetical protein